MNDLINDLIIEDNLSTKDFIAKIKRLLKRIKNDSTEKLADKSEKTVKTNY